MIRTLRKISLSLILASLFLASSQPTHAGGGCGQGGAGWLCSPNSREGMAYRPDEYFGGLNRLQQSLGYGIEQFNAGSRELFSDYPAFAKRMMGTAPSPYGAEGWLTGGGMLSKNMAEGAAWAAGSELVAPAYFGAAGILQSARAGFSEGTYQAYQWGRGLLRDLSRRLTPAWEQVARDELRAAVKQGISFEHVPGWTPWGEPQVTIMASMENKVVGTYPIVEASPDVIQLGFQKTAPSMEGLGIYSRAVGEYLAQRPGIMAIESTIENAETVAQLTLARRMGWNLEEAFAASPLGKVRAKWGFTIHEVKPMPVGGNNYYWTLSKKPEAVGRPLSWRTGSY